MGEAIRQTIASMLRGIERYNPENLPTLENYVERQAVENSYDLEANLAVLKLYQFNPHLYKVDITCLILLKALTNLPHTDFVLCKCLLTKAQCQEVPIIHIIFLADILERCDFQTFWNKVLSMSDLCNRITGFHDSIRKFVCHVVGITYQTVDKNTLQLLLGGVYPEELKMWINKYHWKDQGSSVFIANQDENIKTKNITEKIDFESVAGIMATCK
ncbi:eukaryotic translation initiation factor 3 subunit, putative [Pediculus humanus corporis]|uniref:Eukaryotic translation initiation factor 3 subunit K n=1 Tax=Pediculus humanus subsp. corporis TaxID=121224 RepID=E0VVK8_PEDHC|nr:eukaryotic translation initiation factor 3 subunit, putative [Pediculus humanus corporis]EEB17414.1 eukaryotic translation initiation factor 3 subunit, putative [Pediculus humanus corporis]